MRHESKRLFAVLMVLALVVGLLPTVAFAGHSIDGEAELSEPLYVFTEADNAILQNDVFARIQNVKAEAAQRLGGIEKMTEQNYKDLVPQVIEAIKSSETYVPGTLQQNGSFLVWETTVGMPCCYDPRMEAELHNTGNDPTPADIAKAEERAEALLKTAAQVRGGAATSMNIGLIQPYWESSANYADSSFNGYSPSYKAMWESLANTTGGNGIRYSMTNATVDNIASTMEQCGIVIFDSHGTTDYNGYNDYTSQANSSYLCLTTNAGVTSADTAAQTGNFGTYYHAITGSDYAYVDGTCIANHMSTNAPNSLLYMGICLGMATDGLQAPLRSKGVEVAYGYSQSVSFVGEEQYITSILTDVQNGETFSTAVNNAKASVGPWDHYSSYTTEAQAVSNHAAFPIVVSSEDNYPGQGSVDAVQDVYSTWLLFGDTFNVSAVSNNDSWGTVSVTGYRITAAPNTGYYAAGYSVLQGTATVTQNGNNFLVNPETDCTVEIIFAPKTPTTVTYMASGTVLGTESTYLGDDVTLPTSSREFTEWTFIGWMDQPLGATLEKPAFYKPGAAYTVTAADPVLYALYKHVESNGSSVAYELVEPSKGDMDGVYVISSSKTSGMYVVTGLGGNNDIEGDRTGFTAFANTGIELDDNILRDVDDAYLFTVADTGSSTYSFQSVSEGSYLAVYNGYLYTRANFETDCCRWFLNVSADGVMMQNDSDTNWPYLYFNGSNYAAGSISYATPVQLWKQGPGGDVYYSTAPVVEEHEHELVYNDELAPTCGANGHIAYYRCSICFKYFSDSEGENEISLASTVIPATGNHTFGAYVSNNNGTHTHSCSVCGAAENEACTYDAVVTAPTITEGGYTIYTCTVCGYSYEGSYTLPLGVDYTVVFSVPLECEQPNDMISNTNIGIILPTLWAPEGYKFLGWVEDVYDNVTVRPAEILTGHYIADSDITLYALFKYVEENGSGESAYQLVTEAPDDWTGNYVITYLNDTSLFALTGLTSSLSYETESNGGQTAYSSTGMTLDYDTLQDVADDYVFTVTQESSGYYSIQNVNRETYVGIPDSTLMAVGSYSSDACDFELTLSSSGVSAHRVAEGRWTYLAFSSYSDKFWAYDSTDNIYFWQETDLGTPYWTTIIGEPDPGVDYTLTFTTPTGVAAPAPMSVNSMTGANLPTVTAPEGYRFLGWVSADYDYVDYKPENILTGRYRPQSDMTLKALFKYTVGGVERGYELVTEQLDDWTGNYVITCNKDVTTMIVMHGVGWDQTYEHQDSYGMFELADTGISLDGSVLHDAGPNYVFAVAPQDEGYSIQNLGSENYVGRYCTSESGSSQLYSFRNYDATFCRWTFTYGEAGNTTSVNNVLIQNVADPSLDQQYQYLGCGWYYHFIGETDDYPFFWVDNTGSGEDSDVYYMHLWKEIGSDEAYYTTVIEGPETDPVDVYFVDQDDNATTYVYAFGNGNENAPFPGVPMTAVGLDENNDNYYMVTLDRSEYTNVIFSGGSNVTQTADLGLGNGDYIIYYINNHTGYVGEDIWPAPAAVVEPTCTEAGSSTYTGMMTQTPHTTTLDALGHLPGEAVQENYVEPTATEYGGYDMVVYCQRCNAELSREHTVLDPTGTPEPELDESLSFYTSITIGVEMKTTFTIRQTVLTNAASWYLEVSKLDGSGNVLESKRYGEGQDGAVSNVNNVAWRAIYTDITAKEMGVTFSAVLHVFDADGNEFYGEAVENTVKDYIVGELVKTENSAATRTLCADMLNYGAAAQTYFEYDTDNLVNENLSSAAAAAKNQFETKTEAPASLVNGSNGPNLYGSVSIKNRVVLSITARNLGTGTTVQIQVKNHETGEVKEVLEATQVGSVYTAKFSNVEADEMRTMFDFVAMVDGVETGTPLTWSVEGYIRAARLSSDTSAEELALLNALLIYADSAAAMQ